MSKQDSVIPVTVILTENNGKSFLPGDQIQ